jgi:hypothetical protein
VPSSRAVLLPESFRGGCSFGAGHIRRSLPRAATDSSSGSPRSSLNTKLTGSASEAAVSALAGDGTELLGRHFDADDDDDIGARFALGERNGLLDFSMVSLRVWLPGSSDEGVEGIAREIVLSVRATATK